MKVIYIAGPFRAKTPWGIEQNIRRAEVLSLRVAKLGAMPLCPHTNTRNFEGEMPDQFWLDGTLELMAKCDAVILVEGWRNSEGSMGEVKKANELGIPVFEKLCDLEFSMGLSNGV